MTNQLHTVFYTGFTNSMLRRGYEHKEKISYYESFTKKYNINKLVYYEQFNDVQHAIAREKEIKGWRRAKKIALINSINPDWKDLYGELDPIVR